MNRSSSTPSSVDASIDPRHSKNRRAQAQRVRLAIACSAPLIGALVGWELWASGISSGRLIVGVILVGVASAISALTVGIRARSLDAKGSSHWLDRVVRLTFMTATIGLPIVMHLDGAVSQAMPALVIAHTVGSGFFALIAVQFTRRARFFLRMFAASGLVHGGVLALASEWAASTFCGLWTLNIIMVVHHAAQSRRELEEASATNLVAANTDGMTGLLNRDGLINAWEYRPIEGPTSLIAVDLNRFKEVNDHWGHAAGDAVLMATAKRLQDVLGSRALIGRLGGDEFAALVPFAVDSDELASLLQRLNKHVAMSVNAGGRSVSVSGSIGAASVDRSVGLEVALSNADYAMFEAKRSSHNNIDDNIVIFDHATQQVREERLALERRVLVALAEQQFEWWAQPIVNGATGAPMSIELLVRWRQPDGSVLGPDSFLPILNNAGLLPELGRQTLAAAGWLLRAWRHDAELHHVGVQVNINGDHLAGAIVEDVRAAVADQDLARLGIEIVEQDLVVDTVAARSNLLQLVDMRCLIFIDDFGAGYSSLALLNTLPVTHLKIDRSLITNLDQSPRQRRLVAAIRQLTSELVVGLVAEGVETAAEQQVLTDLDVVMAQGWLHARPINPVDTDFELRRMHRVAIQSSEPSDPSGPSEASSEHLASLRHDVFDPPDVADYRGAGSAG